MERKEKKSRSTSEKLVMITNPCLLEDGMECTPDGMERSNINIRSQEARYWFLHTEWKPFKQSMFFRKFLFSTAYFKYCKVMSSILLWTPWLMFLIFHFSDTPDKIVFPLNKVLVLKLSSFRDATSHLPNNLIG